MNKPLKITIIVVSAILACVLAFLSIYYLWPWNKKFFNTADMEFAIPGLDTAFVPQGMSLVDGSDDFLICGYMSDGSPSRIYLIDGESKEATKYITLKVDNADYIGHAGGIASSGSSIWIVGDGNLYRFTLREFNNKQNGESLHVDAYTDTLNGADFVFANAGVLWVGEFYKKGDYETRDAHHIETRSGETNPAVVYGFTIDEQKKLGLYTTNTNSTPIPSMALSIPALVQGIAISGGEDSRILASTSYGLSDSKLYCYRNVLQEDAHSSIRYGLYTVPLWFLDNDALISTATIPSMSEEIVIKNNRVYILFESACKKYKIFNRVSIDSVYSLPISAL